MAREVTVKSPSIAMGIRTPGFQLLTLSSNHPEDRACFMPDQLGIYLEVYTPLIVLSLLVLAGSRAMPGMFEAKGQLQGLPAPSVAHGRRESRLGATRTQMLSLIVRDFVDAAAAPVALFLFVGWWNLSEA